MGRVPTDVSDPTALVFAFDGPRMLVRRSPQVGVPAQSEIEACAKVVAGPFDLGRIGDQNALAVSVSVGTEVACDGLELRGIRELFGLFPDPMMALAGRAFQILEWSAAHAFCGRCGSATDYSQVELARTCPACGASYYPRITPAVITLVRRGQDILLARAKSFAPSFYSLIAGFVEPGETLEQAAAREVEEEVGIEVSDIAYFASQSWPFPSQLMVGFTADYAAGELRVNEAELGDARWVPIREVPRGIDLPTTFSISGRMIRSVLRDLRFEV